MINLILGLKSIEGITDKDGKLNGPGKLYDDEGKIKCDGNFVNHIKNGKCTEFYKNGKKKSEGYFSNDLYHGNMK